MILVALLPIGTKKFLGVFDVLPEGDYFRIFLNLSDILLLALFAGFVFLKRELFLTALRTVWREYKFLVLFLFFAFISVFFAFYKLLALYSLLRLLFLVFLFMVTVVLLRQERVKLKHIFAVV